MASPDISRYSFNARYRYAGAESQMGRVTTDDDANVDLAIRNEDQRLTRVHVIGPSGSPDDGFRITNPVLGADGVDFQISAGNFYLGGLRLALFQDETFQLQRDRLQISPTTLPAPTGERFDLVYLETYQQSVEAVEDSELFEVALIGPDTTTRLRTMQRVHVVEDVDTSDCRLAWQTLVDQWQEENQGTLNAEQERVPNAHLQVGFNDDGVTDDLCQPSIVGGYLGAENQAIRVQIVDEAHFTWGFDNASPLYRVLVSEDDRRIITLLTEPKDQSHWMLSGQVVEVLPWAAVLPNNEKVAEIQGFLSMVDSSYNPDMQELTLSDAVPASFGTEWTNRSDASTLEHPSKSAPDQPGVYYYLRVWNRGSDRTSEPAIPFFPDVPIPLGQTGVEVTFQGTDWLPGDFWVVAVRPETANRAMPWVLEEGSDRHGIRRFYTPLALLHWFPNGQRDNPPVVHDCRVKFPPLTRLRGCCTYQVGDGVHSFGDYNSIEEAVANLPPVGGKICVLPGRHRANLVLVNRQNIHISGCGRQTVIHPHPGRATEPIIQITTSQQIHLERLTFFTATGTAIQILDAAVVNGNGGGASTGIHIHHNDIIAWTHAIEIRVNNERAEQNDMSILCNTVGMIDKDDGRAAIFVLADDVIIERNHLVVVPPPDSDDPDNPRDPDDPSDDVFDPCTDGQIFYGFNFAVAIFLDTTVHYITTLAFLPKSVSYLAQGGIQIGSSSDSIYIRHNEIVGGWGNGITLGHLPDVAIQHSPNDIAFGFQALPEETIAVLRDRLLSTLYMIVIEDNTIRSMGLSGIGVITFFNPRTLGLMIHVDDLVIYRNKIIQCLQQMPDDFPNGFAGEIGLGGVTLASVVNATIQENRIEQNGLSHLKPTCGIFILLGEKIDISNNRILNNGPKSSNTDRDARVGIRGGIVIGNSFQAANLKQVSDRTLPVFDAVPAVKIHDNIVTQPFGQALFILAFGPVSVVSNQLTSQDADYRINPFSLIAASVFIFNLGVSKDLVAVLALASLKNLAKTNPATLKNQTTLSNAEASQLIERLTQFALLPSGRVLFASNQATLDLRSQEFNVAFSSQLLVSLDDIGYVSNQSECESLIDFVITDVALMGVTIRSNDNRFQEGLTMLIPALLSNVISFSLMSFGIANTATGNQASQCIYVLGASTLTINQDNLIIFESEACQRLRKGFDAQFGAQLATPV